jgi:hypothetical protein
MSKQKVYDCFPFYKELDLIELRMQELSSVVDYFVISEAELTHAGKAKPLYMSEALVTDPRFLPFKDRIIVYNTNIDSDTAWGRENKQRRGLENVYALAHPDDLILLSDADEIPSRDFVSFILESNLGYDKPILSKQFFYYYNFKYMKPEQCHGTIAFRAKTRHNMQTLRNNRFYMDSIHSSGWHCSFFGSVKDVKEKIQNFAHEEFSSCADDSVISTRISNGQDIFGRDNAQERLIYLPNNKNIPNTVRLNPHKYLQLI